jgi:DNA-binding response OmpR family regulator
VEDAEALRMMIREILEGAGYRVIECADPAEALRKPAPDVARAHLLLTDVVMPQASGPEVARSLRKKHPGLKVLFMSGYTNQAIGHHGVLDEGAQLLEKPFTTDSLLRRVRSVLDAN